MGRGGHQGGDGEGCEHGQVGRDEHQGGEGEGCGHQGGLGRGAGIEEGMRRGVGIRERRGKGCKHQGGVGRISQWIDPGPRWSFSSICTGLTTDFSV